jgi:lipoate-protein ligase A
MNIPLMEWGRHEWTGTAADFHAMELPAVRAMWWCQVEVPTLILGSTQSTDDVDQKIAVECGVSITRRRSGGGAVFVHPSDSVWIDITISRDDPLWKDDVSQSMLWLGECFVEVLSPWVRADVYRDSFSTGVDGRVVCFASSSPGEVFVGANKLVGISQRRSREGARFQCVLYRHWQPDEWSSILASADVQSRVPDIAVETLDIAPLALVNALYGHLSFLGGEQSGDIWG